VKPNVLSNTAAPLRLFVSYRNVFPFEACFLTRSLSAGPALTGSAEDNAPLDLVPFEAPASRGVLWID